MQNKLAGPVEDVHFYGFLVCGVNFIGYDRIIKLLYFAHKPCIRQSHRPRKSDELHMPN